MKVTSVLMLPSVFIALYCHEKSSLFAFIITIIILLAIGIPISFKQPQNKTIYARDGLKIAALSWVVMSLFGAIPFYLSGFFPSYLDSVFEAVSGFTTTGSSILTNVEAISKSVLFWRSFTHWIGGMGVIVFILSIISISGGQTINLMKAESPGPSLEKTSPTIRKTAKIAYSIYLGLTVLEIIFLLIGGLPLYDSVTHAFATAGTGGFSIKAASIQSYGSAYIDIVVTVFMVLFGVNFNLYYFLLIGKIKDFFKSEELRAYLGIYFTGAILIAINITKTVYPSFFTSLRYSAFQAATTMSTTGFMTADFDLWPELSKMILVLLMFVGACASSTGGGFKVSRVLILFKSVKREIRGLIHPRAVQVVKMDGHRIDEETIRTTQIYMIIYVLILIFSTLVLSINGYDFETNFTAVVACLNNIGPGLSLVGPTRNFSLFNPLSKIILILDMLFGRLEIFPVLVLMLPHIKKRRKQHQHLSDVKD